MDSWTQERITQWDSESFDEEDGGVSRLVSSGFSGAIDLAGTFLLVYNGTVLTHDGQAAPDLSQGGTVYRAPTPGLPLLFSMQESATQLERGYTEEESYASVHDRLSADNFSGYLLLSEYVMSGDYYVVYHGGEAFPIAFIGSHERLHTGDDALEKAIDEVGIYHVYEADVDIASSIDHVGVEQPTGESVTPTD